jgi:hypothetical protein
MAEDRVNDVAMVVESVRVHMPTGRHVLLLKEIGLGRILPIWIGPWEASAIATQLQGVEPERPLTHDLFVGVLRTAGIRLERVVIVRLTAETFHALLVLATPDARHEVDARPSDAIALAIRMDAPIYAAQDVLDRAAALPDADETDAGGDADDDADDDASRATPRRLRPERTGPETTGEPIDPRRLAIFREFVNSLDNEGDARGGSSS